ncbi:hypothetical protein BsWGS_08888 [Bradybaena similaris]
MNTGNVEVPTSEKIRAGIGLPSAGGKHGPPSKTRRQEHRRRGSASRDSSTLYSFGEARQLVDNHHLHKLAVRTSDSDLYLQKVQPGDQTDISTTLDSDSSMRTSGCGCNYDDVQRGKALELSLRTRKFDNGFSFDGSNRQTIEAGESYVNKLMKQTSDIREYGEELNKLRRTDKEDVKRDTDSVNFETRCAVGNDGLKLSETRVRPLSRKPCSASEYSSKSQERRVSKWSSNFDNQEHENCKNLSLQYQEAADLTNRSKRITETGPMQFDTKNIRDSEVSVTTSNRDYSRHNESVLDSQAHRDSGLKKQHSRPSRNAFAAANQNLALAQDTFSFEEQPTEDIPNEKLSSSNRHEDSWLLRKTVDCGHIYGETLGTDKNFSYSHNFRDAEVCASNPTLTKQRLWEQTILEESTVSADTSQYPHSSIEEDVIGELLGTTSRSSDAPKKRHSLNNSDKPIIVQVSRGPQSKSCTDELPGGWKWKKHFRQCSSTLAMADTFSKDEDAKDETAVHGRWRANVYGTGSSADAANTSSEDDGPGTSLWTCTKWSDENTGDQRHQSKESQWAYEVYSSTCQKSAQQASKVGMYATPAQVCNNTPAFVHSDKRTSPDKWVTYDVRKFYDVIQSSASERNRCHWNSKLDSFHDDKKKVGKLPDFTDILKDYVQLQTAETGKSNDCAAKTINQFNSDYLQRFFDDKQESAGEPVVSMGTRPLEKDQSSHNVKWTRDCGKMCSNPDIGAGAKESSEKYLQGIYNISKLIEDTLANNKKVTDQCEDISPRQTTSSVDAKLMQTVHSIKGDIENVLQMLSSLDSTSGDKDIAASLLNEAFSRGKPFTAANVNCATDFVKQAFEKLMSFKNSFLMQSNEQDDANGYSYNEYKKGRDDYIADPDILDEDYDIQNIFSYKHIPYSDAKEAGRKHGTQEKTTHKQDSQKPKAEQKTGTSKPKSASHKTDKKNVFEKTRSGKRGTLEEDTSLDGFAAGNASVARDIQHTATEYIEPTFLYRRHERGQVKSGKKPSEHFKSMFKDNSKKIIEDSRQKSWRPDVSNTYGYTKHAGAGDRDSFAFANSNSKSRKSSPSPPTVRNDHYDFGHYPTPTFLDSPETSGAGGKHGKKHMKITVEKVMPKRSSSEKQKSRSSKSKTSPADFKWQKLESKTPPLKKATGIAENVSEVDIKRKRSNQLTIDKKTSGSSNTKSRFVTLKMDTREVKVSTAKSKGDHKIASPSTKWKAPRHAQDRNDRVSPPSATESSAKFTGEGLTDTTQTVNTSQFYDTASQDGTSGAEMFVNRYMVVSEVSEATTPGDAIIEEVEDEQLRPSEVPEPKEPSYIRRSKRSSRRRKSRSRSRNRINRRRKSQLFSEQRASDKTTFSSSDTSLLKTSEHVTRDKTTKVKGLQNQEKSESPLRKPSAKIDKESLFHSEIHSPSGVVSHSDVDLVRKVKNKNRETAAARETRQLTENFGNSSNSTLDRMTLNYIASIKKNPNDDILVHSTDKKTQKAGGSSLDMSASELNVSIKKLYEEINKLRLQLEASADDAILRPLPTVDEVPSKFARSYKVFTNASPKFPDPVFNNRQTPYFSYRNMSQQHSQPASCQSSRFSEKYNVQTYSESTPASYDKINEFVTILESHMRNFHSSQKVNNSTQVPTMECVAESGGDNRKPPASKENNAYSCTFETSQSAATAREISTWQNEELYVTATCDDISDTQNDATDKFETAASDNDYSSPNCRDVKSNQMPFGKAAFNSVNNNMRPTESGQYPEVITVYQKSLKVEKRSPTCITGKHFQNTSTSMYEISSGDADNSTECDQQNANCLYSSEKRERPCLVELCSETPGQFKDDAMYVSLGSDTNSRVQCDPRSRGQSFSKWESIVTTTMDNSSQNKGSSVSEQMSEQLKAAPSTFTDSPTTYKNDLGLDQTSNVPFFVKCVKGIFLGSTAAASVMAGNSHQSIQGKQSPIRYSANVPRSKNVFKKESVVSGSDEDEESVGGYINASRDRKQYNSGIHHNSSTSECAPVSNNYLSEQRSISESSRSQSRTQFQGITAQIDGYLLNRDLAWDNVFQVGNPCTPGEVVASCDMNNKSNTLMSQNLPVQSSAARLVESYSPAQTHILETDKVMNHYSDAISAKTSQRFGSRHFSRASSATVSKNQDYSSGTSRTNLSESDRSCLRTYHRGNSQDILQKTPTPNKEDLNDFSNDSSSTLNISEFLHDNKAFLVPGAATDIDQDYIIASFESMMQKTRPYYDEHCKKQEAMLEHCHLDAYDVNRERKEFSGIKATFQVVTIANDNNSSADLNRSKIKAPDFQKNKELPRKDLCDANGADENTCSETTVASAVVLEDGETFSSNDEIDRGNDKPGVNLGAHHNKYNKVAGWDSVNDCKEELQINLGTSLLKPEISIGGTSDEGEADLSSVDVEIEDCREESVDEISNSSGNLLLDTDEAESWYKTTEEVSDIASSMKKCHGNIITEESDDDRNAGEETIEESEDIEDIDYEQHMSDDDDDETADYDSNGYN